MQFFISMSVVHLCVGQVGDDEAMMKVKQKKSQCPRGSQRLPLLQQAHQERVSLSFADTCPFPPVGKGEVNENSPTVCTDLIIS